MPTADKYLFSKRNDEARFYSFSSSKYRCILSGLNGCGEALSLTNMVLSKWMDFKKPVIVSCSTFEPIYQVLVHNYQDKVSPQIAQKHLQSKGISQKMT